MIDPKLGVDVWEGQLEIDELVLLDNHVEFMIIRLNDMNGGHHKDTNFDKQWQEAELFYRTLYFVYNPWVDAQENFNWLKANAPAGVKFVCIDIEVKKDGYSAATYANEVDKFTLLCLAEWRVVIYTGQWFLPYLSYWPAYVPYWWAQYPSELYTSQTLTWDALRTILLKYDYPYNQSKIPGPLLIWQLSGDSLTLPGNSKPIDVNVFYGDLVEWFEDKPSDITTHPYPGVTQFQGVCNGERYFLQTVDMSAFNARVKSFNGILRRVEDIASLDNADIAKNGDDYEKGGALIPTGMSYTDGIQVTPTYDFRYWLNISNKGVLSYGYGKPPIDAYNLWSFKRPLIVDGGLHPSLYENKPENTEIHARSISGIKENGDLIFAVFEGFVNPDTGIAYAGVTLPQAAMVVQAYGAVFAGEDGGGGDAGLFSFEKMVNESSDRDAGKGWRGVVQVIELFKKDSDMATIGNIKGTAKTGTMTNIKPMTGGNVITTLTSGEYVYGEYSPLKTDIINFDHFYDQMGIAHNLGELCKVSIGNLTVITEQEPTIDPGPAPDGDMIEIDFEGTVIIRVNGEQVYP